MKLPVCLTLAAALLASCARVVRTGGDDRDYPAGQDQLVLRITTEGGFVPIQFHYRNVPSLSLLGDGTIVVTGPQIAIYPPPALPNLLSNQLTEKGIQAVLAEADRAGLLRGDRNYSNDRVADAPTTVITVNADGRTHTTSVYALGFEPQARGTERIQEFVNDMHSLISGTNGKPSWMQSDGFSGSEREYEIRRLQIVAFRASSPSDEGIDPGTIDWPLETPLSEIGTQFAGGQEAGRCAVIGGGELERLLSEMRKTSQLTRWRSEGEAFELASRPLLPDEEPCVDELRDPVSNP